MKYDQILQQLQGLSLEEQADLLSDLELLEEMKNKKAAKTDS